MRSATVWRRLSDALLAALALALLGTTVGEIRNLVAASPLEVGVPFRIPPPAGASSVTVEEGERLLGQGGVLFVDARDAVRFEAGHVRGALHVSPAAVAAGRLPEPIRQRMSSARGWVVYCDGEQCRASQRLAALLMSEGATGVRVLVEGWPAWDAAGLPSEKGAVP